MKQKLLLTMVLGLAATVSHRASASAIDCTLRSLDAAEPCEVQGGDYTYGLAGGSLGNSQIVLRIVDGSVTPEMLYVLRNRTTLNIESNADGGRIQFTEIRPRRETLESVFDLPEALSSLFIAKVKLSLKDENSTASVPDLIRELFGANAYGVLYSVPRN